MGNKDLEDLIRKIVKEAPVDYGDYPERMDPRSQAKIEDPEGLYAKNRAFRKGVSDVERIAGTRFKEIVDYVKRYYGTEGNITEPSVKRAIQMEQMNAVRQVMSIEPAHREELRDLCVEIASKESGWMSPDMTMEEALENGTSRTVLKLPAVLAPTKAAIFPLVKKDGLPEVAQKIIEDLKWDFNVAYDEKDAVGRRYRRQDALGTPFCITVDHQTLEDETVTIRHRDTMAQDRVKISDLRGLINAEVSIRNWLMKM